MEKKTRKQYSAEFKAKVVYEEVYLKDYASPREAREELRASLRF